MPEMEVAVRKTHFGGMITYRLTGDGQIEFLVIDCDSKGRTVTKFLGGMDHEGEKPEDTARREACEEGGYEDISFWGPVCNFKPTLNHRKIFFAMRLSSKTVRGRLRTVVMMDGSDTLHPPRWIGAMEALIELSYYHKRALIVALSKIAKEDPEFKEMALADPALAPLLR